MWCQFRGIFGPFLFLFHPIICPVCPICCRFSCSTIHALSSSHIRTPFIIPETLFKSKVNTPSAAVSSADSCFLSSAQKCVGMIGESAISDCAGSGCPTNSWCYFHVTSSQALLQWRVFSCEDAGRKRASFRLRPMGVSTLSSSQK